MSRIDWRLFSAGLLLLTSACAGPANRFYGERADRVRDLLESSRAQRPPVYFLDRPRSVSSGRAGQTTDHGIYITPLGQDHLDVVMPHELAHWYLERSPYATVPIVINEGIAWWVQVQVGDGDQLERLPVRFRGGSLRPEDYTLDDRQYGDQPLEERLRVQGAALTFVKLVGLAKIRELASRDAAPDEYRGAFEEALQANPSARRPATEQLEMSWFDSGGARIESEGSGHPSSTAIHGSIPPGARSFSIQVTNDESPPG